MVYDTMYREKIQDVFSESIDSVRVMSLFTRRQSSEKHALKCLHFSILCAKAVAVYAFIKNRIGSWDGDSNRVIGGKVYGTTKWI